jgi:squalene-hopene/tetraprenyl-beta-curcumene cyclase
MSDTVIRLIEGLPDAADPGSDPYMTALAIVLLRESGVPAADARLQRGVAWLKAEQRASGRWWMHSLYRGNYHFTTYIATAKALQALALCGAMPGNLSSESCPDR